MNMNEYEYIYEYVKVICRGESTKMAFGPVQPN